MFCVAALQSWIQYEEKDKGKAWAKLPQTTIAKGASYLANLDAFFNSCNLSLFVITYCSKYSVKHGDCLKYALSTFS